jgi:cytochrome b
MRGVDDRGELVWDLPLRLFHWLLVLCVAGSWLTHELGVEWFSWHVRIGYTTLVLVVFRVAWGIVGPRHSRFSAFVRGPRVVLDYLRALKAGTAVPAAGHNPLGALSVLAMLALLAVQACTGLFANDEIFNTGPLYGYVTQERSNWFSGIHSVNFDCLTLLIGLHIAAVAYYQLVRHVDIVGPMLNGRKQAGTLPAGSAIDGHRLWLAVALVALAAAVLWRVIAAAPPASLSAF